VVLSVVFSQCCFATSILFVVVVVCRTASFFFFFFFLAVAAREWRQNGIDVLSVSLSRFLCGRGGERLRRRTWMPCDRAFVRAIVRVCVVAVQREERDPWQRRNRSLRVSGKVGLVVVVREREREWGECCPSIHIAAPRRRRALLSALVAVVAV
jgi:hypothetical protein